MGTWLLLGQRSGKEPRGGAAPGHTQGACTQAETTRGAPTAAKGFPLLGADWWGVCGAVSSHVCLRAGVPAASAKPCCALSQSKVQLRSGCRQGPGCEGRPLPGLCAGPAAAEAGQPRGGCSLRTQVSPEGTISPPVSE